MPEAFDRNRDIEARVGRATHLFFGVCAGLCLSFVVWAFIGKLDIVSVADGKVTPSSNIQEIQHLEGGIVRDILVREGDAVEPGQQLVILEKTMTGTSVEEINVRINSLRADIARLEAEIQGKQEIDFPQDLVENHPALTAEARDLFRLRTQSYQSELAEQQQLIQQRRSFMAETRARIKNARENLSLLNEQIAISEELLKDQLTTEYNHLNLLREAQSLQSMIEENQAALSRAGAALKEAEEKLNRLKSEFKEEASDEIKDAKQSLEELTQRKLRLADSLSRTTIRSPVKGLVKAVHVNTVGQVVLPGMTIVEIVPSDDRLVVEAHLPISDIGYVQAGQRAVVRLASRDARRFGKIEGEVAHVSPDAFTDETGRMFYSVRIVTERNYFQSEGAKYHLYPGVLVLTYIHTGKRTVMDYLLDPFLDTLDASLQER